MLGVRIVIAMNVCAKHHESYAGYKTPSDQYCICGRPSLPVQSRPDPVRARLLELRDERRRLATRLGEIAAEQDRLAGQLDPED